MISESPAAVMLLLPDRTLHFSSSSLLLLPALSSAEKESIHRAQFSLSRFISRERERS